MQLPHLAEFIARGQLNKTSAGQYRHEYSMTAASDDVLAVKDLGASSDGSVGKTIDSPYLQLLLHVQSLRCLSNHKKPTGGRDLFAQSRVGNPRSRVAGVDYKRAEALSVP